MSFSDLTPDFEATKPGDDTAFPRFYTEPVQNGLKTAEAGRPVFDEMEFVEINIPGDRKTVMVRRVNEEIRQRWPRQYAAFKQGLEAPTEGTPLSEWPGITRGQVEELRFANVKTVEVLAALPDDAATRSVSMGGLALREKARRYLEIAKGSALSEKLAAEGVAKDAKIDELKGQVEALAAQVANLAAKSDGASG